MIIKNLRENEDLIGFSVYDNETGYPSKDIFAMTEYGKLMRKTADGWSDVPKRGEYVVQYGAGALEVW